MIFKDERHEQRYNEIVAKMKSADCYHAAFAYMLALDENITGTRLGDCFDFSEDIIKTDSHAWHTGFDRRVLQLAFHLWNAEQPCNLDDVFNFHDASQVYFLEAIRIRYEF